MFYITVSRENSHFRKNTTHYKSITYDDFISTKLCNALIQVLCSDKYVSRKPVHCQLLTSLRFIKQCKPYKSKASFPFKIRAGFQFKSLFQQLIVHRNGNCIWLKGKETRERRERWQNSKSKLYCKSKVLVVIVIKKVNSLHNF